MLKWGFPQISPITKITVKSQNRFTPTASIRALRDRRGLEKPKLDGKNGVRKRNGAKILHGFAGVFGCRKRGGQALGDRHFSNRRSRLGTLPKKQIKPRVQLYCKTLINTHFPPQNFTNLQMVQNVNKHIRPSIFKASPTVSNFSFKSPFLRLGCKRSRVQISMPRPFLKPRQSIACKRVNDEGRS